MKFTKCMMVAAIGATLVVVVGCDAGEVPVKTVSSGQGAAAATPSTPGGNVSASQGIGSSVGNNPNIPDSAKKAMGVKAPGK